MICVLAFVAVTQAPAQAPVLTLDGAVRRALTQFPSVAAARSNRDRAAADAGATRGDQLPRVAVEAGATRFELPMLAYPLHGVPTATAPAPGGPLVFDETLYEGRAFVSWTFFDFGARSGRTRASRALADAAEATVGAAEQALVARTAGAYLRTLSARQVLAAHDNRIEGLSAEADRTRRLLNEGKIARVEVLRADAALARARADRSATAGQLDVAERELAQLTGMPHDSVRGSLPAVALVDTSLAITRNRAALLERAAEANPDLLEARRRRDAAQAAAGAARATRFPELRASAGIVDRGAASSDFRTEWQAGLGVSYPIYTGGQRAGTIARAAAEAQGAAEQVRLAEVNVALGVDRALAAVIEAHARVQALVSAVEQSETVAQIERTALEVGSGTQTDYLDALSIALQTSSQLIEARHTEIAARVELARVTGELSPQWIATHLESAR